MKRYLTATSITWIFIVLSWLGLSYILYFYQINTQLADTTFVTQIYLNFKNSLTPNTSMGISLVESMDHIWGLTAEQVCNQTLETRFTSLPWFHYYFIMFLLVPFAKVMNARVLIAVTQAAIFLSVLVFTYYYARKKQFTIPNTILMIVLVSQHPLWHLSLYGQYYFNRFFLIFVGLFIWLLEKKKLSYTGLILTGILAISTNEIYGVAIFSVIISYLWINKITNKKLLIIAAAFLAYTGIAMYLIQYNLGLDMPQTHFVATSTKSGLSEIFMRLYSDFIGEKTQIFLVINIAFMGILAFFNYRTIFPFILFLLPNLFINIGGAEKTGWSTHYHTSYFIPLIWLSINSLVKLKKYPNAQTILISIALIATIFINPNNLETNPKPFLAAKDLYSKYRDYKSASTIYLDFRQRLENAVGAGESATLLEPLTYHLYEHEIYYYPHNIDVVDNVILRYDPSKVGLARYSSISYGRQFDPQMDKCILERMQKQGYNLDNPTIVDRWAVIKRAKN
jgi:hypothetical protein